MEEKPIFMTSAMKILSALLLLLSLSRPAWAFCDGWQKGDTALYSMYTVAQVIDVLQTRTFLHHPNFKGQHEVNPDLGKHPSDEWLYIYNLFRIGATLGIACVLPETPRKFFLFYQFVVEVQAVQNNYQVGVRIKF